VERGLGSGGWIRAYGLRVAGTCKFVSRTLFLLTFRKQSQAIVHLPNIR
jgi:hypothetical protein